MNGKLAIALMGGSTLVLLVMVLAYNTDLEKKLIRRARSLLMHAESYNGSRRDDAPHDANSTHVKGFVQDGVPAKPTPSTSSEPHPMPEDPEEFEYRLRQMVSRFWAPFSATTPSSASARRRRPDVAGDEDEAYEDDDDVASTPDDPLPPHSLESPFQGPQDRANWFLVQERRRHGSLGSPGVNRTDEGQFWHEDSDDVGPLWDNLR